MYYVTNNLRLLNEKIRVVVAELFRTLASPSLGFSFLDNILLLIIEVTINRFKVNHIQIQGDKLQVDKLHLGYTDV